jgi:hypothetical protein
MFKSIVGALVAPTLPKEQNDGFTRSTTIRITYNPITRRFRLVRILTIEGQTMNKPKEEKDVLTPAPEWVQDELPLSFS